MWIFIHSQHIHLYILGKRATTAARTESSVSNIQGSHSASRVIYLEFKRQFHGNCSIPFYNGCNGGTSYLEPQNLHQRTPTHTSNSTHAQILNYLRYVHIAMRKPWLSPRLTVPNHAQVSSLVYHIQRRGIPTPVPYTKDLRIRLEALNIQATLST